jgi:hypothetical protein
MAEPREPSGLPVRYRGARFDLFIRPWKLSDANVAREVLERRCYEKHSCLLSNCSHWLDAGAHIGCFAIAAALSGCRVDSFEPEPDNARAFRSEHRRRALPGYAPPGGVVEQPNIQRSCKEYLIMVVNNK